MMQRPGEARVEPESDDTIEVVKSPPPGQAPAFGAQARSERAAPPPILSPDLGEEVDAGQSPGFKGAAKQQEFA